MDFDKKIFWGELAKRFPADMHLFLNWYGQQKYLSRPWNALTFVDMPFAFQMGAFLEYVLSTKHRYPFFADGPHDINTMAALIEEWFHEKSGIALNEYFFDNKN